jgi:hypothetical protein
MNGKKTFSCFFNVSYVLLPSLLWVERKERKEKEEKTLGALVGRLKTFIIKGLAF